MVAKKKNLIHNDEGQALLEFLGFLPFIIIMYLITITLGGAIFGSINQQKAARGYLYARVKNNSYAPKPDWNGEQVWKNWTMFGSYIIGWKDRFEGAGTPMASCYKVKLPTKDIEKECDSYATEAAQFVRVMTVYGICGATYRVEDGLNVYHESGDQVATPDGCLIK